MELIIFDADGKLFVCTQGNSTNSGLVKKAIRVPIFSSDSLIEKANRFSVLYLNRIIWEINHFLFPAFKVSGRLCFLSDLEEKMIESVMFNYQAIRIEASFFLESEWVGFPVPSRSEEHLKMVLKTALNRGFSFILKHLLTWDEILKNYSPSYVESDDGIEIKVISLRENLRRRAINELKNVQWNVAKVVEVETFRRS
jgi:hypothetical protein